MKLTTNNIDKLIYDLNKAKTEQEKEVIKGKIESLKKNKIVRK